MRVFIVGEDPVARAVIKKILSYCNNKLEIITELPARGSEIKNKIKEFNTLSAKHPIILLTDLDSEYCAPILLKKLTPDNKNEHFILNIAVDETEAWLMADKKGFAEYFGIEPENMPVAELTKQGGKKAVIEMSFKYKSSMYLTHELIKKSKKTDIIKQLTPKQGACKGPEYNQCIIPFVRDKWNIDHARKNSDSLNRMIIRIKKL
jgi:hypothetical protein